MCQTHRIHRSGGCIPLKGTVSRKIRLTPVQRDILWMLEESGAESLATIVSTLKPVDMTTLGSEIHRLASLGLVDYYRDLNRPSENYIRLTLGEIETLPSTEELLRQPRDFVTGLMLTKLGRTKLVD